MLVPFQVFGEVALLLGLQLVGFQEAYRPLPQILVLSLQAVYPWIVGLKLARSLALNLMNHLLQLIDFIFHGLELFQRGSSLSKFLLELFVLTLLRGQRQLQSGILLRLDLLYLFEELRIFLFQIIALTNVEGLAVAMVSHLFLNIRVLDLDLLD